MIHLNNRKIFCENPTLSRTFCVYRRQRQENETIGKEILIVAIYCSSVIASKVLSRSTSISVKVSY